MSVKIPPDMPCVDAGTEHRWRALLHADGCHVYTTHYGCELCGARFTISIERDVKDDPYSAVWMNGDDAPEGERCERCVELLAGAEPVEPAIIVEAGTR